MSTCCSNPSLMGQNQEILAKESSNEEQGASFLMRKGNPGRGLIREASMMNLGSGNGREDDIEDDESEFTMGRLIRQASLDSSRSSPPQRIAKVMTGSSSLPRYPLQKPEANQEKMRNRSKNSMKMGKKAPTIPAGWVDKGSSEDMKEQIKFWARAVAFNVHQDRY
ncbi:uncharacterized protein LOC112501188 [Cynara cardunculus var. scolymus]|uniref:uncharacterized protein LOC112501188 n=1 Tax=Cynara cardunculus var. scolymus TaxID=59895 RepID=UPI000D626F08|nr:uncharacterized protein LOC112501188 [Cynara cardunculus var. scolymus]